MSSNDTQEQPPSVTSQPKLLPPLRNVSLHHRQHVQGIGTNAQITKASATPSPPPPPPAVSKKQGPSMVAAATASAVAMRLGRGRNGHQNNGTIDDFNSSNSNSSRNNSNGGFAPPHKMNPHGNRHVATRGGIHAATTTALQDIVRLERDLDKIFSRRSLTTAHVPGFAATSNNNSGFGEQLFSEGQSALLGGGGGGGGGGAAAAAANRNLFLRYSKADIISHSFAGDSLSHENTQGDQRQITSTMNNILETLKRHTQATQLPYMSAILGVLAIPFSRTPLCLEECHQALDLFDYIRERFVQLDAVDNLEQIMFCCRLLITDHLKLKMRLVDTVKLILASSMDNPNFLPSSFTAFHALVYTLADALSYSSCTNTDRPHSRHEEEFDYLRTTILDYLDKLSSGIMIPLIGKDWDRYFIPLNPNDPVPLSVARLCVVEGLCRTLMATTHAPSRSSTSTVLMKRKHIIQDLLPRYWEEPEPTSRRAYSIVLFVLAETATDWFLQATVDDLRSTGSAISLLLCFVQEKITLSKLQTHLPDWEEDSDQKAVYTNTIAMMMSLLSITNLRDIPSNGRRISPSHSPQLSSTPDFPADSPNMWSIDESLDRLSLSSGERTAEKAAWRRIINNFRLYFESFWSSPLQNLIISVITETIEDAAWDKLPQIYENLAFNLGDAVGDCVVKATFSTLLKRLVDTVPPPTQAITNLLVRLSQCYRQVFYRHVVSCAASDDEHKVSSQLMIMTCLRKYLSGVQFWMHDAEMINVLLLSDIGSRKGKQAQQMDDGSPETTKWGSTTLGQCVVAAEFMLTIKDLRDTQGDTTRNMEEGEVAKKFLIDLERRLAVFMAAKEKTTLVPLPLRVILCNIFLQIRFFCNITHRPGWLTRAIEWAIQPVATLELFQDTNDNSSLSDRESSSYRTSAVLQKRYLDDVSLMFQRLRLLYATSVDQFEAEVAEPSDYAERPSTSNPRAGVEESLLDTSIPRPYDGTVPNLKEQTRRRKCINAIYPVSRGAIPLMDVRPPCFGGNNSNSPRLASEIAQSRIDGLSTINQDPFGAVLSLLVAVFTSLTTQEFGYLVEPLWSRFIDDRKPSSFVPAAFLLMQCSEKVPKAVVDTFTHDFYSGDPFRRLSTIEKQAALSGYRFNILAQEYIQVSSRKRPFRGDGGAFSTPFVPADLGSNRFTMDEPRWMAKLKHASNFPIELKRQIQELGWDDDQEGEEHEALKKVLTPLALLPSLYLEEEDEPPNDAGDNAMGRNENEPRRINISKIIARKKRAATVHALTATNLSMIDLLSDEFGGVGSALRELLESHLRDDPGLFLRPFLSDLGKTQLARHREILTRLRFIVDIREKLPPGFAYLLFNYLAGMLKWMARENHEDGLPLMTLIHPILAELVLSTNELSTRDLRKNKVEHLLVSTGQFWFTNEQPASMFPRRLTDPRTPFTILEIPWEIFGVAMLRVSHIQFLTNFLLRYPREVYAIKKTLREYEPTPIPTSERQQAFLNAEGDQYFPDISLRKRQDTSFVFEEEDIKDLGDITPNPPSTQQEEDVRLLSLLRARVWLRFIDTILNGLNKNYNDRGELERILKGVNLIIMEHTPDFGIIGQALVLYTRIVTRFKRLFLNNRGHGIFLPALFRVFCEVERYPHIRSAIIFAWCRFYAVHEEAFVFQMLGALVPVILNGYEKSLSLGAWMTDNLFNLMQAMHNPPKLGATSDVLGLQLQVELDDHDRSIQERIDAASNPMAMPLSATILKPLSKNATAPIIPLAVTDYDGRPFPMQNFVKLFLTIIAYDPGSLRAEQFVRMFRHLLPRFCKLGNLGALISDGVSALIEVFLKFSKNAKPVLSGIGTTNTASNAPHMNINVSNLFTDDRNAKSGSGTDTGGAGGGINSSSSRGESTQHAYGKQWQQNDRLTIKKEFVRLVEEFFKFDGILSESNHEKMAQIIRMIMRDYASLRGVICTTDWIKGYLTSAFQTMVDTRNYTKSFKTILTMIYGQYRAQWKSVDGADLYQGLAMIMENGQDKTVNMHDIGEILKERFVQFGLTVATRSPSDWEVSREARTRYRNALVRLIVAILENSTQDVLQEIESVPPSVALIGDIIIPVCLEYDLRWSFNSISLMRRYRPDPTASWMRLLAYVSKSCNQASISKSKGSGFSLASLTSNMAQGEGEHSDVLQDPKVGKHTLTSVAHLFSLSIVAMKIILIRGAKSFDRVKGAWVQIAYFLKGALIFGQTLKSLRQHPGNNSGRSTPRTPMSPRLSPAHNQGSSSNSAGWPGTPLSPESGHVSFPQSTTALSVNILYDYATWCFLEYVISYKSPLSMLLRGFVEEKLHEMGSTSATNRNRLSRSPTGSGRKERWKSWGYDMASPITGTMATHPTSADDGTGAAGTSILGSHADDADAGGLGLHIPTFRVPPAPHSPALSIDESSPISVNGHRSRVNSRHVNMELNGGNVASTELHVIQAETMTALMNIQASLGYKTALPWGSASPQQPRPWSYRVAISKVTYEWRLILQLHTQLLDAA
ncbi:hypothetical protein BX666DRAFT_1891447 [Dichotomocladium elegans]|nr:hypothetical protein BX666DRAFT_1891447 [Dichotomocladium elegans]